MRWSAVGLVGRRELRRRWVPVVALGVVAGLVGAVVLGALQLTRRTSTAPERLAAAMQADDARVSVFGGAVSAETVAGLPGVQDVRVSSLGVGQLTASERLGYSSVSGLSPSGSVFTPVVVEGRSPREDAADEVVVAEEFAEAFGLAVGDVLPLALLTAEELNSFDVGFGEPDGPRLELRVVGLVRLVRELAGGTGTAPVLASSAFAEQYAESLPVTTVLVRLEDRSAAGRAALQAQVAELDAALPPVPGGEEFPRVSVQFPALDGGPALRSTRTVLVTGLLVLVGVSAVAGLLGTGQALGRHAAHAAAAQRVEQALGLTTAERALARGLPALPGAVAAGLVAAGGALLAARVEPLGSLAGYEPEPGWRPDLLVVGVGAAAVSAAFALGAVVAAARVLRRASPTGASASARPVPALVARRAAPLVGTSLALTRGRSGNGVPARTALTTAVLGVVGVVAAATFGAGLDRLAGTPERYGWTGDFAWVDAKEPEVAELLARPEVAGLALVQQSAVSVEGVEASAYAADVRRGREPWTLLQGREPSADDEVALGARLADRLDVAVGERVALAGRDGDRVVTVVGRLVVPAFSGERFGEAVVLTPAGLEDAQATQPFVSAVVDATTPAASSSLVAELAGRLELEEQAPPRDVQNLLDLGRLPDALGIFLGVLSLAVLAHALVLTTRRRAADLAVLRVVGFTPRQVGAALLQMATTTAVVGLLVGLPLGVLVGRVLWSEVAGELGVARDVAVPWAALGVVPVAVLLTAAAVALLPARRAARVSPATVLRAE